MKRARDACTVLLKDGASMELSLRALLTSLDRSLPRDLLVEGHGQLWYEPTLADVHIHINDDMTRDRAFP
eukprot:6705203-Prymnesium_polylepis.1